MFRNRIKMGSGTGFIYFHKEMKSHYLITNYHVLTARDPKEPAILLDGYPDSPDELRWLAFKKNSSGVSSVSIDLLVNNNIEWIEHSMRDQGVDIAAVKIKIPDDIFVWSQDKLGLVDDINVEPGSYLSIVGYPGRITTGNELPIWKNGTIASEPMIKPNNLSRFYINANTTPGISGSPVFAVENRLWQDHDQDAELAIREEKEGKISALDRLMRIDVQKFQKPYLKKFYRLVGIYSGRLVDFKDVNNNIGIVWNFHLIEELFTNPTITEHPYPPQRVDA
jgi:hypothetical protein